MNLIFSLLNGKKLDGWPFLCIGNATGQSIALTPVLNEKATLIIVELLRLRLHGAARVLGRANIWPFSCTMQIFGWFFCFAFRVRRGKVN